MSNQDTTNDLIHDDNTLTKSDNLNISDTTSIDEPDRLRELFEDYHIVKYDNVDGYNRIGDSESDWYELYTAIQALISDQVAKARKEELIMLDEANIDNGLLFCTTDKETGNGWKTLSNYIKWRISTLNGVKNK